MNPILAILAGVLKLITLFFEKGLEKDKARKAQLETAEKEIKHGIKTRDASLITSGFDRARRV